MSSTDTKPSHSPAVSTVAEPDPDAGDRPAHWPARIRDLGRQVVTAREQSNYEQVKGELWCLLNTVLAEFCQYHATGFPLASREDIEDIASNKALDLLNWIVLGRWNVMDRSPGEIARFVSRTSKNELRNLTRKVKRRVLPREETRPEWDVGQAGEGQEMSHSLTPDAILEQREFARALRACVQQFKPRMRKIWYLRVFCGMPSKQIATHPDVRLKADHIDVLLQRGRQTVRRCMGAKGYEPREILPGTLSELWQLYSDEGTACPVDHDG